ncbi:hypothetical protein N7465_004201 [Penicillium sp. CMV-2018d]|nr:hypothetical protein N7465_004201 [Penicillium sp. CMV-2018d]
MKKPTSTRPSKPRHGFCSDEELQDSAQHVETMNKRAQFTLSNAPNRTDLPYYDEIQTTPTGALICPPGEHRLSDALVFLIIGQNTVAARHRHGKWPSDFDVTGDTYCDRWPMGDPVVMWCFGLPFLAVYGDYYVMTGSPLRHFLWNIDKKPGHYSLKHKGFHFGEVVVSPTLLKELTPDRGLQINYKDYGWGKFEVAPDVRCDTNQNWDVWKPAVDVEAYLPQLVREYDDKQAAKNN